MFGVGLAVQAVLKLFFNLQRIISKPKTIRKLFNRDLLSLAIFLSGFTGMYRVRIEVIKIQF